MADIGVGTGYIARRIAPKIGETGTIYGVDIQQEMLDLLDEKMAAAGITNVKGVLGTITDPKFAAGIRRRGDYGGCLSRVFASV